MYASRSLNKVGSSRKTKAGSKGLRVWSMTVDQFKEEVTETVASRGHVTASKNS
jgi:hypothetical protein